MLNTIVTLVVVATFAARVVPAAGGEAAEMANREMLWSGGGDRSTAPRFSLLHMDEGEDYVADHVGLCRPPPGALPSSPALDRAHGKLRGIVRLLSKSLLFDPDERSIPMLKFPLRDVSRMDAKGGAHAAFELACARVVHLRPNGEDVPYVVDKDRGDDAWTFDLAYADVALVLEPALTLLAVSRLPPSEADDVLREMRERREDEMRFDETRTRDLSERVLFDAPAAQSAPLVREPGRLVVTTARVYFQPLHDVTGCGAVRSHPIAATSAVVRRRKTLRPLGVEIFFARDGGFDGDERGGGGGDDDGGGGGDDATGGTFGGPAVLFTLRTEASREACVRALNDALASVSTAANTIPTPPRLGSGRPEPSSGTPSASALLEGRDGWLESVAMAWRKGRVSNLDYLLYLNVVAGRGFNDLAQWPVMPWILKDYASPTLDVRDASVYRDLTRPIGALNPERLKLMRDRYASMKEGGGGMGSPFMYGSHYSAPGYVLYWLVRAAPAHHLRLQCGKFDAPDRLFHSVADAWDGVMTGGTDVKELSPEFFAGPGDFFLNSRGLALGTRQKDGVALADVQLPRWCGNSPAEFLRKHRDALESEHVSDSLHSWIDLIFGWKQTGDAAAAADNVFHPLTYDDALAKIEEEKDPATRRGLEAQIDEFGQTPRRLFSRPHPRREEGTHRVYEERPEELSERGVAYRTTTLIESLLRTVERPPPAGTVAAAAAAAAFAGLSVAEGDGDGVDASSLQLDGLDDFDDENDDAPVLLTPEEAAAAAAAAAAEEAALAAREAAAEAVLVEAGVRVGMDPDVDARGLKKVWTSRAHRVEVAAVAFAGEMSSRDARSKCRVITVGRDSALKASCATDGASKHVSEAGAVGKAPLSSLALWPPSSSANGATATVFAGSYDGAVRAYALSVNGKDYGVVGRLPAHDAAVAAIAIPALDRSKLFTASWDGAVRAWDVGAGGVLGGALAARVLQSSSSSAPPLGAVGTPARRARRAGAAPWVASTSDLNAEAWCLACDPTGDTVFAGGEDGAAIAWDPRYRHAAWRADACPSGRGVHALSVMPCRTRVAAACGDGVVRTLELRMCGESSAEMNLGIGPLSCVLANGARGVLAGGKKHEWIVAWDPDGFHPERCFRVAGVDGPRGAGVSCASVASDGGALVLGWDDGSVGVFAET